LSYQCHPSTVLVSSDGIGQVNQAGIDHYNKLIDALLAKGEQDLQYFIETECLKFLKCEIFQELNPM
jgi:hypothetical protein